MKSTREISVLLILAMGLTLLPAPFADVCDLKSPADTDLGGPVLADSGNHPADSREPGHENGHCCETCCQNCGLPCCSGTVMIPTPVPSLDAARTVDGCSDATAVDVTLVDPDPLYHPPRG